MQYAASAEFLSSQPTHHTGIEDRGSNRAGHSRAGYMASRMLYRHGYNEVMVFHRNGRRYARQRTRCEAVLAA